MLTICLTFLVARKWWKLNASQETDFLHHVSLFVREFEGRSSSNTINNLGGIFRHGVSTISYTYCE